MPIQTGDIQFVKTQVMDDVPEGGGGPTGVIVPSGTSNAIFPDVSESDRAVGNVRMRKLVLGVKTDDTDTFLGPNVILAEPPNDANVSIAVFSTGDMFDRREDAVARLEAYLNIGPTYAATLYGNHIAGQNTLLMYQKTDTLPPIGATLVLTKREGFEDQAREYVRVTEAGSELREFEDSQGKFTRYVVTLKLQNFLSQDFGGFDMSRFDFDQAQVALRTKISDTVVADAARYYGVSMLEDDVSIGEFTIKAESMFTQLVPSAQIETPIADARTNQLSAAVISSGTTLTQTVFTTFNPSTNLFIGGAVAPGTLSILAGAVELTDAGGRLLNGGTQVGNIDYENGVASLLTDVFGGAATFTVVYSPAAAPIAVTQSQGVEVTAENRSSSRVCTIEPPPVRGTMTVSYMAQGRWYVLRDDGSGALRGSSTAFGAGNINFSSGTVAVTLGALPDVGSSIIYQWVEPTAARAADALVLDNDGKFYWPFNTSGESSTVAGAKTITPGALSVDWDDDGVEKNAVDDGQGRIVGDATGSVNYAAGVIRLSPNTLPAPGTPMQVNVDTHAPTDFSMSIASGTGNLGYTNIDPGSLRFTITAQMRGKWGTHPVVNWGDPRNFSVSDDRNGKLLMFIGIVANGGTLYTDFGVEVGTINYTTGDIVFYSNPVLPSGMIYNAVAYDNLYVNETRPVMAVFNSLV